MTPTTEAQSRLLLRLSLHARILLATLLALLLAWSCAPAGDQAPEDVVEAPPPHEAVTEAVDEAVDEAGEGAEAENESEAGVGLESEAPVFDAVPEPEPVEPTPPEPMPSESLPPEPLPLPSEQPPPRAPEPSEPPPPAPDPTARVASESERLALDTVDVFYGTNRARHADCRSQSTVTWDSTGRCQNEDYYVAKARTVEPQLEVGTVTISLPPDHETGKIERPTKIFSIQLRKEDPSQDVVLSRLRVFDDHDSWAGAVRSQRKSDAFIYVHGYATSFHDAALRAGQVSADLDFDEHGVPMFFSWPSAGDTESYVLDYDVSVLATDAFNEFLDLVHDRTGVERVHVIAHSMGNRVVANALRERDVHDRFIDQLILAAPDIHAETFRQRFLRILPDFAERVTLYVSDKDVALQVSERLRRQNPRAGQRRGGLLAARVERFDPVDATDLETDFLSHSYYANHSSMLSDIYCVLRGAVPEQRPLVEPATEGWRFREVERGEVDAGACAAGEGR